MPVKKKMRIPAVNKDVLLAVEASVPVEITKALPLPPNTTEQQDIITSRQSRINLIWEVTQSIMAFMVVGSTMYVGIWLVIHGADDKPVPTIFSVAFGVVTGFYFARTNHQAIGGVGPKANAGQEYTGR